MLSYDDERMLDRHERQWLEEPDDYEDGYEEDRDDEERERWEEGR